MCFYLTKTGWSISSVHKRGFGIVVTCYIFAFFLHLLFEGSIDHLDALDHIVNCQLVLVLHFGASVISVNLLWHYSCLVLDEIESLHHELCSCFSVHSNCQHANDTTCKAIVEAESRAGATFHIEGDRLQATHVEECFVLDLRKARVVQEVAEHKASGLVLHTWSLFETSVLRASWVRLVV